MVSMFKGLHIGFYPIEWSDPYVCWGSELHVIIQSDQSAANHQMRFGLNGAAHIQKNLVSNLRSPVRTVQWGNLWVDLSPLLDMGLPPASFVGYDTMSDSEAAVLLNSSLALRCRAGVDIGLSNLFSRYCAVRET